MHEASYYKKHEKGVQCVLCPRNCIIPEGKTGFCRVRKNEKGKLYSLVYEKVVALNIDPIEKKPLFHFYPGERIFSFGTVGCNLACKHCQNYDISQVNPGQLTEESISVEELVDAAIENKCKMIAATYNEPTIFFEFMLDVFKLAKKKGLKTVVVSNGFINEGPLKELLKYADAFNIDLKGFDAKFYPEITTAWIEPILATIKTIHENGNWLEITNLVIPTKNDDAKQLKEMCIWIKANVGENVPTHFSAFFPMYKLNDIPPTSKAILDRAFKIAKDEGLNFVYQGNLHGSGKENTCCPECNELLVEREGYHILKNEIKDSKCPKCGRRIEGFF